MNATVLDLHAVTASRRRGCRRGETRRAVFEGAGAEHTWALKDLDPALPADWSPLRIPGVGTAPESPQRFDLRIHDAGGVRSVRLSPVPGAWVRSAVPLSFLTQAAHRGTIWPRSTTSCGR